MTTLVKDGRGRREKICVEQKTPSVHEASHLQWLSEGVAMLRKERLEVVAVQEVQGGFK